MVSFLVKSLQHLHCNILCRMIPCSYMPKQFNCNLPQQIPIVDIGPIRHGVDDHRVVEDVCFGANIGAFQVINHGINDKQVGSHCYTSSNFKTLTCGAL